MFVLSQHKQAAPPAWRAGDQLRALSALTGLSDLNLKGCYKVADAGLAGVGALSALTALCLHECWQITAQGLLALSGAAHPHAHWARCPRTGRC